MLSNIHLLVAVSFLLLPVIATSSEQQDRTKLEVLDTILLASVDGQFHALNRTTGQKLWSMSLPTDDSVPANLGPLIHTQYIRSNFEESGKPELYTIDPQSGDVLVQSSPDGPFQRLPYPIPRLVEMVPFSIEDGRVRRIFIGKKEHSLLLIELETGRTKPVLGLECSWDVDLNGNKQPTGTTEVLIKRTDYHINAITIPQDKRIPRPPVQRLVFSTYGPNEGDTELQNVTVFEAPPPERSQISHLWSNTFQEPIVVVFDVARSSNNHVLLQPRPSVTKTSRPGVITSPLLG